MPGLTPDEESALRAAADHGIAYRQGLPERAIPPRIDAAEARRRFGGVLPETGAPVADVIETMVTDADDGLMQMGSPGYFGYVMGASHPAGIAADMLCAAWGQIAGYAEPTPSVAAMENAVCKWVIDLLGLPEGSGAGIVTGATMGNAAAVMAARNALLHREGWDVEARGLFGAPEVHVLIGAEAHSATAAALRYAGLGAERVHRIAADDQGRMRADAFAQTIAPLDGPILVILQAGHINSCAFDPFSKILPAARAKQAWVHVDGAFGLWVNAVPDLAHQLDGISDCDSWAVDLHKWLNAPYDAGMVITRDRGPLVASMSAKGSYLPSESPVWDPNDSTPELSRRARGVPSYAILRTLGKHGVREMVAGHCRLARRAAEALAAEPGITVLNDVVGNQVAMRCGDGAAADAQTRAVLERVQAGGRVYPSHGTWHGGEIIRVSVIGHKTTETEIDLLVEDITAAWRSVSRSNT